MCVFVVYFVYVLLLLLFLCFFLLKSNIFIITITFAITYTI